MSYYNKTSGLLIKYYNNLFYLNTYRHEKNLMSILYTNFGRKKMSSSCLLVYPIINKKIFFIEKSCKIVKKKGMKNLANLNQTIILEASISSQKCIYTIPIFSIFNHLLRHTI